MSDRPDTSHRLLIAAALLILILWLALGGHALWTGQPWPVAR